VKRRPITLLAAAAVAAVLVLASWPMTARASGITNGTASYRLTTTTDIPVPDPSANAPQVIAAVVPPGTVVPPTQTDGTAGSPLTILKSSTGFDQSQLIVALKDGTTSNGSTQQLFGLSFFGNGLSKNGQLDFSLNLGNAVTTAPQLQSLTPGVTIAALDTTSSTTTTSTSTPTAGVQNIPEPMSVVLWSSALAGAGLLRGRRMRRRLAA
jgi:hypothetical protein